jgi:hypothetical protein
MVKYYRYIYNNKPTWLYMAQKDDWWYWWVDCHKQWEPMVPEPHRTIEIGRLALVLINIPELRKETCSELY